MTVFKASDSELAVFEFDKIIAVKINKGIGKNFFICIHWFFTYPVPYEYGPLTCTDNIFSRNFQVADALFSFPAWSFILTWNIIAYIFKGIEFPGIDNPAAGAYVEDIVKNLIIEPIDRVGN